MPTHPTTQRPRRGPRPGGPSLLAMAVLGLWLAGCEAITTTTDRPDAELATVALTTANERRTGDGAPTSDLDTRPLVDPEGVQATLDALAAALLDADPDAVVPLLADPEGPTGTRWRERAANLAEVPIASYELRSDPDLPTLTTAAVRERWGEDAQLVLVGEEHRLSGHDEDGPRREQQTLTLVPDGGRWLLADDRGGGALGLVRGTQLWDLGPVEATQRGPLLALHRPAAGGIEQLLAEAETALELARDRWPLPWSEGVPVLVPADTDELADLLNVTFDLEDFVAFATSTPWIRPHEHGLTGSRIVLNPERFDERDARTRELVLVHELLHVASRPRSTASTPLWLEEGVAQVLGEQRSSTGMRLLAAAGPAGRRLPLDAEFTTGGTDGIHLAYQRAWSFTSHLVDRFGAETFARFHEQVGVGSVRGPGTVAYRVDQAARDVLGAPIDELVADWRAAG
jgi:hypothetical protein